MEGYDILILKENDIRNYSGFYMLLYGLMIIVVYFFVI